MAGATLTEKMLRRALARVLALCNARTPHFVTYHRRPKYARQVATARGGAEAGLSTVDDIAAEPAAIVMQGPIATEHDATLETLRLYARHMPWCRLILSTWADTDPALLAPIEREGVEIVLCDKPDTPGLFNVNMLLASARAGVEHAVAGGAEWILKTRTDQRLYRADVVAALIALARAFPVGGDTAQRHRIIGVGHGTLKFAPYHLTDQTVFGHAEDMRRYWGAPLRTDPPPAHWPKDPGAIYHTVPIGEECRFGANESYLASHFLLSLGRRLDWTLADSWAAYRDHFCVMDYGASDFFWTKVQPVTRRELLLSYGPATNRTELGFADWLLLHGGQLPVAAAARHEHVLETPFATFDTAE